MLMNKKNKPKLLKTSPLFFFALLLMLSSCDVSKRITYFQDIQEYELASSSDEQPAPEIRLRPEDKISIIVNSKVPELTALFNNSSLGLTKKPMADLRS